MFRPGHSQPKHTDRAEQIKILVKQISHGNSATISRDLFQSAILYCNDPHDAQILLGCIFDAIDSYASHSAVVYRCLTLIRAALANSSPQFASLVRSFAADIRLITCLAFEGPKCPLRGEIHAMALALYHSLVHEQSFAAPAVVPPPPNPALVASLPLRQSRVDGLGSESESVSDFWSKASLPSENQSSDGAPVEVEPELVKVEEEDKVQKIGERAIRHEDLRALFRGIQISDPFETFVVPEFSIALTLPPPMPFCGQKGEGGVPRRRGQLVDPRAMQVVPSNAAPSGADDGETFDPFGGIQPS
jgi:hypothetical protein